MVYEENSEVLSFWDHDDKKLSLSQPVSGAKYLIGTDNILLIKVKVIISAEVE